MRKSRKRTIQYSLLIVVLLAVSFLLWEYTDIFAVGEGDVLVNEWVPTGTSFSWLADCKCDTYDYCILLTYTDSELTNTEEHECERVASRSLYATNTYLARGYLKAINVSPTTTTTSPTTTTISEVTTTTITTPSDCGTNLEMCNYGDDHFAYPPYDTRPGYIDFYTHQFSKGVLCKSFDDPYIGCGFAYDFWFGGNEFGNFGTELNAEEKVNRWNLFLEYGFHPDTHVETRHLTEDGQILAQRSGNNIEWRFDVCYQPNPVVVKSPNIDLSALGIGVNDICYATYYIKLYSSPPNGVTTTTIGPTTTTIPPACGNGVCDYGETSENCPSDCERFPIEFVLVMIFIISIAAVALWKKW